MRAKRRDLEHELQKACFRWFSLQYPKLKGLLFAVPNGSNKSMSQAVKFKSEGLVSGIPDLLFLHKGKLYAFELKNAKNEKSAKGKLQDSQKAIHEIWERHGVETILIWDFKQFQEYIINIIENG